MLAEARGPRQDRRVEIVGTDIASALVERATAGRYTAFEMQRGLSVALRDAYFTPEPDGGWRAGAALRSRVRFGRFNLLDDMAPLGRFDVIFCRNVLIYFDPPTKRQVLERMARQLAPDGVLYLGGAETALGVTDRLTRRPDEPCCRLRAAPTDRGTTIASTGLKGTG